MFWIQVHSMAHVRPHRHRHRHRQADRHVRIKTVLKNMSFRMRLRWVGYSDLRQPHNSITLGKAFIFSEPQIPSYWEGAAQKEQSRVASECQAHWGLEECPQNSRLLNNSFHVEKTSEIIPKGIRAEQQLISNICHECWEGCCGTTSNNTSQPWASIYKF